MIVPHGEGGIGEWKRMTKKWMAAVGSSLDLLLGRLSAPLHHPYLCLTLTLILPLHLFLGFPPNILKMKTESKMRLLWLLVGFTLLIYTFLLGKRSYLFPLFFIYYFFPEDGICTPHVLATIPMFFSFGFLFRPFTTCFLKRWENK